MARRHWILFTPGIYGILIGFISTCLFSRAFTNFYSNLIDPLKSFDYLRTYVELYFLLIFDALIFIFVSFIFIFKSSDQWKHLSIIRRCLFTFQLFVYAYCLTKFLIFYDWTNVQNPLKPRFLDVFDRLNIVFLPLISIFGIAIWSFVLRSNVSTTTDPSIDPERQPLIDERNSQDENRSTRNSWWRILKLGRNEWKFYVVAFFFLVVAASCDVLQPFFSGHIISSVVVRDSHSFFVDVFSYMAVSFIYVIASGLRGFIFTITGTNLIQRLRNQLFSAVIKQEVAFFDKTKTGEITSRLSSDITTVGEAVSTNFNIFLRSAIQTVGIVTMMLVLSWNLFLLALITGPLAFGTAKIYGDLMTKQQEKIQNALAEANALADEAISTIRTVKSYANEDEEIRLFEQKNDIVRKLTIRQALYYFGYLWNGQILIVILYLGTLVYGGHLVMNNRLDVSNFVSFILYQQRLGDILDAMNSVYASLMKASGASMKLFEYLDRVPEIVHQGQEKPTEFQGRIEFRNVNFSFPNRKDDQVLKNVSFTVEPGEQVALVGPSGSGKTTCIALLERFYDVDQGEVLVDGIPIENYDYKFYHEKVSLVSQEPVLHARSIRDNIRYGLTTSKTQDEIESVAQLANAHTFITQFQKGYETECGERGVQMAGGQKQRIALARALIRSPNVLLLDEATSALDAEAEAQVQEAIARTVVGRTVLIIAHRLSTIRHADKILVLERGQIVEAGTHSNLMEKKGLYYQLVKRQTEHYATEQRSSHEETSHHINIVSTSTTHPDRLFSTSFNVKESI